MQNNHPRHSNVIDLRLLTAIDGAGHRLLSRYRADVVTPQLGWLSTLIVHDLRNPLGTVLASAEMLRELDPAPTHVKRLAANIHRAAGRMRELLADLTDASRGNRSTREICKVRDVIAAASEAALPVAEKQGVRILNHVPSGMEIRLARSRYGARVL